MADRSYNNRDWSGDCYVIVYLSPDLNIQVIDLRWELIPSTRRDQRFWFWFRSTEGDHRTLNPLATNTPRPVTPIPVTPRPITPTPATPTPVTPTASTATVIVSTPTTVAPTAVASTTVAPTSVTPTSVTPTPITPPTAATEPAILPTSPVTGLVNMSNMTTPSPHPDPNRNRLPTLFEVLSRQTLAPVDLFSFYIFMRDQQRSVDYLDFWLDVSQHMSLCRHYVRELRRSVLVETPDLEKQGSKRSSYILDHLGEMNDPSGPSTNLNSDEKIKDQNLSAYLRHENGNGVGVANGGIHHSPHSSMGSQQSGLRGSGDRPSNGTERPPRPSFMTNGSPGRTNSNSPAHTVARADIRASAEKILYTYLLPGSEREIILPQGILTDITTSIEEEGRDDPEVFDAAKDYTFQAMERDAFPGFLRAKALGNLVPPSSFLRLCIGLLSIFGGFWAGFACILLDKPKHIRCWLILPFTIGVYALSSQQYSIDPVLALAGLSEYTFMNWSRIREPYIRKLMNKRALMVLFFTVLIGVCLIVLFIFVPGHRL